jgi:hypothetical protein
MQRRILWHMRDKNTDLVAETGEGARTEGFGCWIVDEGGLAIRAYSHPLYFMRSRGLIEPIGRNARGIWYRLTDAGREAQATVKTCPRYVRNIYSNFGAK